MNYPNILQPLLKKFMPFAQKRMGFSDPPRLFLKNNSQNASDPLGRTAHYDPNNKSITVYVTNRHPKDIMRSISHELVHHTQNCRGEFDEVGAMGDGYAQNDEHLREMEREAYEVGNLCFRDWEDSIKNTIYFEHLQKGENKMSTKDWKNEEIKSLLSEAWGFKMDLSKLNEIEDLTLEDELPPYDERQKLKQVSEGGGAVYNRDEDEKPIEEEYPHNTPVPMPEDVPGALEEVEASDDDTDEDLEEASNPRDGNEDRQRPGRNPADRVHESDEDSEKPNINLEETLRKVIRSALKRRK